MWILKTLAVLVIALVAGLGTAWWRVQHGIGSGSVQSGPWATNAHVGAPSADAALRAAVAVVGLLALNRSETVYYNATHDSDGKPLSSDCTYRIIGRDPSARWWSITAYADDNYLIPNPGHRYSVGRTTVVRDDAGGFVIRVGGEPAAANWIATPPPAPPVPFSLTLRLYNPGDEVTRDLAGAALPRIEREACA